MKSLHKILDIIETLAKVGTAGIREISSLTGYPAPTIHRMVSTLVERDYLKQDPGTRKLSLSFKFLALGASVQERMKLTELARPHLERLMQETRESVNLAIQDGDYAVYLEHVQSDYTMLQLFTKPGARVPLYCTGVGKAFLSRWSDDEVRLYLARIELRRGTPKTLADPGRILEELARIRRQGFSVDNEEMEEGVRCVAALIYNHKGEVEAAVSISGAAMRITPAQVRAYAKSVQSCALAVSRILGFRTQEVVNL
ncbi:MAG: IclR family transcriptional regulator [Thermodesulfobacteriota bacterium]